MDVMIPIPGSAILVSISISPPLLVRWIDGHAGSERHLDVGVGSDRGGSMGFLWLFLVGMGAE